MIRYIVVGRNSFLAKGANEMGFLSKILDGNNKEIKQLGKLADKVIALEEKTAILTDEEIRNKTKQFQTELADIDNVKKQNDYLDKIFAQKHMHLLEKALNVYSI